MNFIAVGANGKLSNVSVDENPTRRRYPSTSAIVMIGPVTEAQAVWGVLHPDQWLTVRELKLRCGKRTVAQVRSGM